MKLQSPKTTLARLTVVSLFLAASANSIAAPPFSKALTTLERSASDAPTTINLTDKQVFVLYGFSLSTSSEKPSVTFKKTSQSYSLAVESYSNNGDLPEFYAYNGGSNYPPVRGPGSVTISGQGLVSYEVVKVK